MPRAVAYVDQKWPDMWRAIVASSGAQAVPVGSPIDWNAPAILRGLQYGSEVLLTKLMARRHPFWFIDSGYFRAFEAQPRLYYRIVRGAFHQNTIIPRDDGARWRKLGLAIKDWRRDGRDILVCPPASLIVKDLFQGHGWLDSIMRTLPLYTDRSITIRPKYSPGSIIEAGRGSWAVVTHLSNVAVDLAIEGIPAFVWPGHAADPVANHDLSQIENPHLSPDRLAWAQSLACGQFTVEEMASGEAWEMMQC